MVRFSLSLRTLLVLASFAAIGVTEVVCLLVSAIVKYWM